MTRFHIVGVLSLLMGIYVLPNNLLASHPFHASSAEVEWNPDSGNFEISLCVWPADLEKAIAQQQNQPVDLDQVSNLDEKLAQYISSRFSIAPVDSGDHSTATKIRWVGHEMDLRKAWLYFEIPGDRQAGTWKIENRVFFELNEDQVNQVQVKSGGQSKSVSLNRRKPTLEIATSRCCNKLPATLSPASLQRHD